MEFSLERRPDTDRAPVYQRIAGHFRAEIEQGRLGAGDRLPTIRALARGLGVNRETVALAYESLAREGWIESTVGRGTFVRRRSAAAALPAFEPALSPLVERLLDFERARPRYGAARDTIAMHALVPDPSHYPVEGFRRALARAFAREGAELLVYGGPQGHAGLRAIVAERLRGEGIAVDAAEIVLSHGASEGIALALRLFARPGDAVAVEEPTYTNVLAALVAHGLEPVPVPMGHDGLDLAALERVLARPEVKLLYTIPTFHNPMGVTTSLAHRRALLATAARASKPVVEDAYQMDLRFAGKPVPTLAGLDERGLVVQLFSFSKSLFPGVRVGALAARGRAVEGLLALKAAADLGGSPVLQAALAEFVREGGYDRHLARVRRRLRGCMAAAQESLAREMPEGVRWTDPQGGYQIWVELPAGLDTRDLFADAARAGVLFAPGHQFHHDGRGSSGLRLTLARVDETQVREGVARLASVARARLAERGAGAPALASAMP
jgi:GntR family transcriptional regulator/MocR family aminotransferase